MLGFFIAATYMNINTHTGRIDTARWVASPNYDVRPDGAPIDVLVIHNISLPPNQYGGQGVEQLFTNTLNPDEHPYYKDIAHVQVSSHLFIRRTGELVQFVSLNQRAWHAGVSSFEGRERCNDFSIGIELEGSDFEAFEETQYQALSEVTEALVRAYPGITLDRIIGHSDIAPDRKTDPGPFFDWQRYKQSLIK